MPAVTPALSNRARWLRRAAHGVLLLGLTTTLLLWNAATVSLQRQQQRQFQDATQHASRMLGERLLRSLEVLAGFRALFEVSDQVTRADFHRHARALRLTERFPGVIAVQYAPLVQQEERAGFEAATRGDISLDPVGYPDYAIHPAGERDVYLPVLYNEPMAGNESAFGHDTAAEPSRRRVMERSRDTGEPMATGPLELLQGQTGFLVRHAVYRRGMPLWTVEQRRAAFSGQVSGVFRTAELLSPLLQPQLAEYRVRVLDRGVLPQPDGVPRLLYDSRPTLPPPGHDAERMQNELEMAGRLWRVELVRPHSLPWLQPLPLSVLLGGLALTLALLWLLHSLANHYRHASALAERLLHQAQHDSLTGLPNRMRLEQELEQALQRAAAQRGGLALLFLDLDRFKTINDSLGHAAGDAVLQAVALRLRQALRPGDTVARLGGDEFIVLLTDLPGPATWHGVADRLLEALGQPIDYGQHRLQVGASLGVALYPQDGRDAATLMREADGRMYQAKRRPVPALS
ncbi:diguanylate cyclase domain-containing protein [Pseudoroseomonas cervicalis]|uniref:diguanylate cyclase domain-containing protein n=1 Tax=Teichococcus cervicalis TaxID=204525 RepID=UPI0022F1C749|nr:diguanylate cyclase [Pseudoroseomonas cervicalis]WBV44277.1 diguanylate cyclase [Pseudoroseomonas cervicalis]